MSLLFEHADILLRKETGYETLSNAYLGIKDGKIAYIGESLPEEKYDQHKNMQGKLLMPGLVNCHSHIAMTLLRGIGNGLPLQRWLFEAVFPIEDRLTPDEIVAGCKFACMEMIASGTTSFVDMYFFIDEIAEAVKASGMRANLSRAAQVLGDSEKYSENRRAKENLELFDKYHGTLNDRLHIDFSLHAEYTNNEEVVRELSRECKRRGARMHIHMSETPKEHRECIEKYGKTPAQWFNDLGTFENPTEAAHCVAVSDEDLKIMKAKNVHVSHNPSSNLKLGSGFAPIRKMLDAGINVAIGTDGVASNNNLNMFEEMHLAAIIHNGYHGDPTMIQAQDALDMGTVNGGKLMGREDVGVLAVGNKADIIAIDMSKPHLYPNFDTPAILTCSAQGSDVCMTMVDGNILYENGVFLTMDAQQVRADMEKAVQKLYQI